MRYQPDPFKYHSVYKVWGGYLHAELKWHRGGQRVRRGPYNKTREMNRRVTQMAD